MPIKHQPRKLSRKALLDAFREAGQPLRVKTLYGMFEANAARKKVLRGMLAQLVESKELVAVGKSYALPDSLPKIVGILDVRRSGVGYLVSEERPGKDIFLHPSQFGGAWPGDTVAVVVVSERRKDSPEGRVVDILKRASTELLVRVSRRIRPDRYLCHPTDSRMPFYADVDTSALEAPEKGDVLLVRPDREGENGLWLCTALRLLGREKDLRTQELLVKTGHGVPERFPEDVLRVARALPTAPDPVDWADRLDARSLPLVTIDGENAKDFDDAVFVQALKDGFRLVVAIADVAHYVPEGSALDLEARERGNSYYFPLSVEPMLPESLSNGLCSLKPHEPRLAMVVDAEYGLDGTARTVSVRNAVIRSHARLTYEQVQAALDGTSDSVTEPLLPMLRDAEALARAFMRQRMARGCLDFDIPEPRVSLDGETVRVATAARLFSHRLIEEFMIAANERVAEYLGARERVFPYRTHPEPDERKLENLLRQLSHTSLADRLPVTADQAGLRRIADAARGTDVEYLVSRLLLRTMMQARYEPENVGHYGLASGAYCHFTSPIRRYADLLVHRAVKRTLARESEPLTPETLQVICDGINACERKAQEAEREILKRAAILSLEDRVGETLRGVVSGVSDFGFWVELVDIPVDGLVRLASLDDYYLFDEERQELLGQRTGRTFALGQTLRVVLEQVSLERVEINFVLPRFASE